MFLCVVYKFARCRMCKPLFHALVQTDDTLNCFAIDGSGQQFKFTKFIILEVVPTQLKHTTTPLTKLQLHECSYCKIWMMCFQ